MRLARRCALALLASKLLVAQLATGVVEGTLSGPDGRPSPDTAIFITGNLGFHTQILTGAGGEFAVTLIYGVYRLRTGGRSVPVVVNVAPLRTTRVTLVTDATGTLEAAPLDAASAEVFSANTRQPEYPEALTMQGLLLSQEPSSVTQPLNFTAFNDNHLAVVSQRGFSWTDGQYRLLGMDATDSYQPGRPMILPDLQAVEQVVVGGDFERPDAASYAPAVSVFLAQPGSSWHATLGTWDTGGFLSSSNLPAPPDRGLVQQPADFRWFTRDSIRASGPITKWADISVTGTAQWSLQTVPLAPPGTDQRSRILVGDVRGRFEAGPHDQFDALFSGSRINLPDWATPEDLESLAGRRMSPPFSIPGGYSGESGIDHLDFLQAGWTHQWDGASRLGVMQLRYGDQASHLSADPPPVVFGGQESKIEMLGGAVTGAPPISDLAVRTRQGVEDAWQPRAARVGKSRHQIVVGAGWKTSSSLDRVTIPSDISLTTVDGAPSQVVEFNSPLNPHSIVRAASVYAGDQIQLMEGLALHLGVAGDFTRGSLPAQTKPDGQFVHPEHFAVMPDLIAWNSLAPRAALAWQIPGFRRLVLRAAYYRIETPLAGRYLDFGNTESLSGNVYQWIDRNGDGQFQLGEEGPLISRFGGAYSSISRSLARPYSDEYNLGTEWAFAPQAFFRLHLFRRDNQRRIAAIDTGVTSQDYSPVGISDPGTAGGNPVVYQQNPATFGQDQYLLTNPAGLQTQNTGLMAELGGAWRSLFMRGSLVAEKSTGLTNPGDAFFENDPGVVGALYSDPNTLINAARPAFMDRDIVAKVQATYRLPAAWGGVQLAGTGVCMGGLPFTRQLLVTGLAQGPFLVTTGLYRGPALCDANFRILREFKLAFGRLAPSADILNVTNAGRTLQENDFSGAGVNLRLPAAIQEARTVRFQLRYEF
ncbi:MAG: hypothetical protein ABSF54_01435 [Bryobacteraceae bacterium]